jgi:hypothetical protein
MRRPWWLPRCELRMRALHIIPGLAAIGSSGMVYTAYATDAFTAAEEGALWGAEVAVGADMATTYSALWSNTERLNRHFGHRAGTPLSDGMVPGGMPAPVFGAVALSGHFTKLQSYSAKRPNPKLQRQTAKSEATAPNGKIRSYSAKRAVHKVTAPNEQPQSYRATKLQSYKATALNSACAACAPRGVLSERYAWAQMGGRRG